MISNKQRKCLLIITYFATSDPFFLLFLLGGHKDKTNAHIKKCTIVIRKERRTNEAKTMAVGRVHSGETVDIYVIAFSGGTFNY